MAATKNPAARAEPDGGVDWFGSVFGRRSRRQLEHKGGDGGAPGAGALGIDGADANMHGFADGSAGHGVGSAGDAADGGEVPVRARVQVFRHGDLEFVVLLC